MPGLLPIRALHHIAIATRDYQASVRFYCDVLGFRELPRPPFAFRGAWLFNYEVQIHIIEHPSAAPELERPIDSRDNHLAFAVTDLDLARERLQAAGTLFSERVNAGGVRQLFLHDPDGHTVELAVYGDPSVGYQGSQDSAGN